jgi:hypothetical protein
MKDLPRPRRRPQAVPPPRPASIEEVDVGPASSSRADSWPALVPFDEDRGPLFPVERLPPVLADWVAAESVATQTPPDLAATVALAVASASIAKKVVVRVKPGWTEPVNLYLACVLAPGNRTSAVVRDALAPVADWERRAAAATASRIDEARRGAAKSRSRRRDAVRGDSRTGAPEDAARLGRSRSSRGRPLSTADSTAPRVLASDVTPARLAQLLAEHGGRLAFISPEAEVFDVVTRSRASSGVQGLHLFLAGHAGDPVRIDRAGRQPIDLSSPVLTIFVRPQPKVLQELGRVLRLRGLGLLARFLYSVPTSWVGARDVDPPPVPPRVDDAYRAAVESLLEFPAARDGRGEIVPRAIEASDGARDALLAFASELEPLLAEGGELEGARDWVSKLAGAAARIAGCLHVLGVRSGGRGGRGGAAPIDAALMEDAVAVARYFLAHVPRAFDLLGVDARRDDAQYLLRWIVRNRVVGFSTRDCFTSVSRERFENVARLDGALDVLVERGHLRRTAAAPRPGPGRRASPVFAVNPAVFVGRSTSRR